MPFRSWVFRFAPQHLFMASHVLLALCTSLVCCGRLASWLKV